MPGRGCPGFVQKTILVAGSRFCPPSDQAQGDPRRKTLLREWAYARFYVASDLRNAALLDWLSHYNQHRPYTVLHGKPALSGIPLPTRDS